jgi:antirestriction protein ArdC
MATRTATQKPRGKRSKTPRRDLYQEVTDKIIAQLETGTVPWVQPWGRDHIAAPMGLPTNAATGNRYSGINILLLWGAAIETARKRRRPAARGISQTLHRL